MEKIIPSGLLFFYKNSKKPQKLLSFLCKENLLC